MTARVAIVGYGVAGEVFHAPLIAATPAFTIAGIVTADPARRDRAGARFPDARLMMSDDEIWADPQRFDLVVVCSPNRTHVPLALRAVDAGLAVVIDKPVAASVADAIRVRDAAAVRGVAVTVFQNRRWDGDFLTVRRLLDAGLLGKVHRFESRFERHRPDVARAWRESPDPADAGGVLYDLGSHLIDQALVLFGPVETVYAEQRATRAGARVDDDTFVALQHANGVVSHCWMSLVAADPGPRLRVLGDRGAYVKYGLDGQEAMLRAHGAVGASAWGAEPEQSWGRLGVAGATEAVPTERGCYERFYALLADALAHGGPVPVPLDDAIDALRVIEAARASALGRTVERVDAPAS